EDDPDHERDRDLEDELRARGEAEVSLLRDLQVVVEAADPAERDGGSADDPDEGIEEVRPQKSGHDDRRDDEQAPHRRRSPLQLVRARALLADLLTDLELTQLGD